MCMRFLQIIARISSHVFFLVVSDIIIFSNNDSIVTVVFSKMWLCKYGLKVESPSRLTVSLSTITQVLPERRPRSLQDELSILCIKNRKSNWTVLLM